MVLLWCHERTDKTYFELSSFLTQAFTTLMPVLNWFANRIHYHPWQCKTIGKFINNWVTFRYEKWQNNQIKYEMLGWIGVNIEVRISRILQFTVQYPNVQKFNFYNLIPGFMGEFMFVIFRACWPFGLTECLVMPLGYALIHRNVDDGTTVILNKIELTRAYASWTLLNFVVFFSSHWSGPDPMVPIINFAVCFTSPLSRLITVNLILTFLIPPWGLYQKRKVRTVTTEGINSPILSILYKLGELS